MRVAIVSAILIASLSTGCLPDRDRTVLEIDASGAVAGLIYVDRNGDSELTAATDIAAAGVSFAVVRGQRDTIATGTTNSSGVAVVSMLPVGSYRLVVDTVQLGDSLEVGEMAPSALVQPNDTTPVLLALQHVVRPVREVRASPSGKLLTIEGVALNGWATFGDSTVHVADTTGAMRVVRARGSPVTIGDSVRIVGRATTVGGDQALTDAEIFVIGSGGEPVAAVVTTGQGTSALNGSLAAALVSIQEARVIDSRQLVTGDVRLQVDDGSGILEVLLDRHAGITSEDPLVPGAQISARGVLVPIAAGRWQLKPRGQSDFEARIRTVTIAEARATATGHALAIEGVALNAWAAFGDGSVHLADSTGSIRVSERSAAMIAAGDSLRFVGMIQLSNGQPVLASAGVTQRGLARRVPNPIGVFSAVAAAADGGALDATLVKVAGAVIDSVKTVASETHLVIDDGTGQVTVVLDRDTGISSGGYAVGDVIDVVGLLVPSASGTWLLKPRTSADLGTP